MAQPTQQSEKVTEANLDVAPHRLEARKSFASKDGAEMSLHRAGLLIRWKGVQVLVPYGKVNFMVLE